MNRKTFGLIISAVALLLFITMIFVKESFDKQSIELCEQAHGDVNNLCPVHDNSRYNWLFIMIFILIILLLLTGIFLYFIKDFSEERGSKINVDISKLTEEERKILEKIKEAGGSLYQSDIVKETGLSKVKTTRILDKLELKGIIERKRRGMTNIIVLK